MLASSIPIGSPLRGAASFTAVKEEWPEEEEPALEAGFKPDLYLLLDGVLPSTIEDWETELEKAGPIINDLFLGPHTDKLFSPRVKEEPLSVAFVGAVDECVDHAGAGNYVTTTADYYQDAPYPAYTTTDQQLLSEPISVNFHYTRHKQISFTDPSHYGNASSLYPAHFPPQPVSMFDQQITDADELHMAPSTEASGQDGEAPNIIDELLTPAPAYTSFHTTSELIYETLSVESSSLEVEEESMQWEVDASGMSRASSSSPSSSTQSQEEILEEIQRECAEIEERNSLHSPSQSPAASGNANVDMVRRGGGRKGTHRARTGQLVSDRKKALNRIAATKYRKRRRQELEVASSELVQLEARNRQLKADVSSVQTELIYLKNLISEINARAASS